MKKEFYKPHFWQIQFSYLDSMEKKESAIVYRVCYTCMYIYSIKYICIQKLYIYFFC